MHADPLDECTRSSAAVPPAAWWRAGRDEEGEELQVLVDDDPAGRDILRTSARGLKETKEEEEQEAATAIDAWNASTEDVALRVLQRDWCSTTVLASYNPNRAGGAPRAHACEQQHRAAALRKGIESASPPRALAVYRPQRSANTPSDDSPAPPPTHPLPSATAVQKKQQQQQDAQQQDAQQQDEQQRQRGRRHCDAAGSAPNFGDRMAQRFIEAEARKAHLRLAKEREELAQVRSPALCRKSLRITCGRPSSVDSLVERLAAPRQPPAPARAFASPGAPVPLSERVLLRDEAGPSPARNFRSTAVASGGDGSSVTASAEAAFSPSLSKRSQELVARRSVEDQLRWEHERRQRQQLRKAERDAAEAAAMRAAPTLDRVSELIVSKNRLLDEADARGGKSQTDAVNGGSARRVEDRLLALAAEKRRVQAARDAPPPPPPTSQRATAAAAAAATTRLFTDARERQLAAKERAQVQELLDFIDPSTGQVLFQPQTTAGEYYARKHSTTSAAATDCSAPRSSGGDSFEGGGGGGNADDEGAETGGVQSESASASAAVKRAMRLLGDDVDFLQEYYPECNGDGNDDDDDDGSGAKLQALEQRQQQEGRGGAHISAVRVGSSRESSAASAQRGAATRAPDRSQISPRARLQQLARPKVVKEPATSSSSSSSQQQQPAGVPEIGIMSRVLAEIKYGGMAESAEERLARLAQPKLAPPDCNNGGGGGVGGGDGDGQSATRHRQQQRSGNAFSPSINARSAAIDAKSPTTSAFAGKTRVERLLEFQRHYAAHRERLARQKAEAEEAELQAMQQPSHCRDRHGSPCASRRVPSPAVTPRSAAAFFDKQQSWAARKEMRLTKERSDRAARETDGCSFAPATTPLPAMRSAASLTAEIRDELLQHAASGVAPAGGGEVPSVSVKL